MYKRIALLVLAMIILIYSYNFYTERQRQKEIAQEFLDTVEEIFFPLIENTAFSIDGDTYYLVVDGINTNSDYNFTGIGVTLNYMVYKNSITEENLLFNEYRGFPNFFVYGVRYNTDHYFELEASNRSVSYLSQLFDSFTSFFYDYHFDLHNDQTWSQKSGSGSWNEDDVVFDYFGLVEKEGTVQYSQEITAVNQKMFIEAEFLAKPPTEKTVISLEVIFPEGWR